MILQPRMFRDARGESRAESIRSGDLEVRLAATPDEIDAAQALRYRVFYEEMGARGTAEIRRARRDRDRFDLYCDHLIVIDRSRAEGAEGIVATYRLLRHSVARRHGGFYTATEFDIAPLLRAPGEQLELGRSCVAASHRTRPTMQLLWRGIAEYCWKYGISLMFGCASLPGTDVAELAPALAYLHYNHLAPPALRARALPDHYVRMDLLPPGDIDAEAVVAQLANRGTVSALPPLIKGYLRIGALIGEGAVIDRDFNTTDVCIIVVVDRITGKYFNHYRRQR